MRECYDFGAYRLDVPQRTLWRGGGIVSLTAREFDLLWALLRRLGTPVDKHVLLGEIWPENPGIQESNVTTQVRTLRRKLGKDGSGQEYIRNISNQGYFIVGVVRTADPEDAERPSDLLDMTEPVPEESRANGPTGEPATRRLAPVIVTCPFLAAALAILLTLWGVAADTGAYGLAIVLLCAGCGLASVLYTRSEDTPLARSLLALLLGAVMAYIPSASSLKEVVASVVNATTLTPALVYPFITGLKFIPLFVLVLVYWALSGRHGDWGFQQDRLFRDSYLPLGGLFLLLTGGLLVSSSGEDRIWREALPGYRTIASGYGAVVILNVVVGWLGYRAFFRDHIVGSRSLAFACAVAYLPLAAVGFIIDETYNSINRHALDQRRPEAYYASNPEALQQLKRAGPEWEADIGPDLRSVLQDPAFERALRTQPFYKQNFDEPFQLGTRAVMFGYQPAPSSPPSRPSRFVMIRFPEKMAAALQFHAASE